MALRHQGSLLPHHQAQLMPPAGPTATSRSTAPKRQSTPICTSQNKTWYCHGGRVPKEGFSAQSRYCLEFPPLNSNGLICRINVPPRKQEQAMQSSSSSVQCAQYRAGAVYHYLPAARQSGCLPVGYKTPPLSQQTCLTRNELGAAQF